jgi:DNA-binding response OmpR family regulator
LEGAARGRNGRVDFTRARQLRLAFWAQNPDSLAMSGTILFVDDEPDLRIAASNYFHHFGYNLLTAENADEALGLADRFPVDVIVLDVNLADLAGKDGSNLLASLKRKRRDTPIILYSGLAEGDAEVKDMLRQGAHRFVPKAGSLNGLLEAIRNLSDPKGQKPLK